VATEAHGLAKLAPFGRQAVGAKYFRDSSRTALDRKAALPIRSLLQELALAEHGSR
jgi:hypothetical protein